MASAARQSVPTAPGWLSSSRLWLVLDQTAAAPRTLLEAVDAAVAGGVDVIVFRHLHRPTGEVLPLAKAVRGRCQQLGVPFVLSHYPDLTTQLAPDALHLGIADPPLAALRAGLPAGLLLGASTHSVAEAQAREAEGFDYTFLGPVYATTSKLAYGGPLGLEAVAAARLVLERPVIFIGGINQGNIGPLIGHAGGAARIAVISAVLKAPDITVAARQLRASLA